MPPSVVGDTMPGPNSGYSSDSMNRAPPIASSAWPMRPSSPVKRVLLDGAEHVDVPVDAGGGAGDGRCTA